MLKSKIFAEVLTAVSAETEISEEMILSKLRSAEVVDARCLFVKLLSEYGLYPSVIARMINRTAASVRYLIGSYEDRKAINKYLENNAQNIRNSLKNNY